MHLYPSIDVRDGNVVRLHQGDYGRETVYGGDPVAVALQFADAGAGWIHVVDLDAARTGRPANRELVVSIAEAVPGVRVQTGGGVRDEAAAEALLDGPIARVVVGTAAMEDPTLVRRLAGRHPGRIAVGLDARGGEVAVRGWTKGTGTSLLDAVVAFEDAGIAAVISTNIDRDATLRGPDLTGMQRLLEATDIDVIASGGVSSLDDLQALARLRTRSGRALAGAIVGKAIYEGRISVEEGVAACAASE